MNAARSAQSVVAPFAICLTIFLWAGTCAEILSRGTYHSLDLTKLYLLVMSAYAGAAEISKWLVNAPTDPTQDPRLERMHRGGFFVWLWFIPLLATYSWRFFDPSIPVPAALEKITSGLVTLFFLKAASRKLRHKEHGVINASGAEALEESDQDRDITEIVYEHIAAAPQGMSAAEIRAAIPKTGRSQVFRALEKLLLARRIRRSGRPHRPDARYHAVILPSPKEL